MRGTTRTRNQASVNTMPIKSPKSPKISPHSPHNTAPQNTAPHHIERASGKIPNKDSSCISLKSLLDDIAENGRISQSEVVLADTASCRASSRSSRHAFGEDPASRLCQGRCVVYQLIFLYVVVMVMVVLMVLILLGTLRIPPCQDNSQHIAVPDKQLLDMQKLRTELNRTISKLTNTQIALSLKVLEISRSINKSNNKQGQRGPPGHNGTQGERGLVGPKGSGDMSLCQYKFKSGAGATPGRNAVDDIFTSAARGKIIVGATCSTDGAAQYVLESTYLMYIRMYTCRCKGTSSHFIPSGKMHCYIHYWECPLVS